MIDDTVLQHMMTAIGSAPVIYAPWPFVMVPDVFPATTYNELLIHSRSVYYGMLNPARPQRSLMWLDERTTLTPFWNEFMMDLFSLTLRELITSKFGVPIGNGVGAQVIHDLPGYAIGPHTDIPVKLMTGLFYLPETADDAEHGTAIYVSDSGFESDGTQDHELVEDFRKILTVPYLPNSALFFPRTDWSWHGVETSPVERWLISYDVYK